MKPRSPKSIELYNILMRRGYPQQFAYEVTCNLNTDWTAQRMIGYLSNYPDLPMVEVADEVLSILSERNQIMQKMDLEEVNAKWNAMMWEGFGDEDEE